MSEIKLKPCPFCGGKAEFTTKTNSSSQHDVGFRFVVICTKCHVCAPKTYEWNFRLGSDGEIISSVDEREEAAGDWNRRGH